MKPGTIGWIDLTCENASEVRNFYAAVAGWEVMDVPMDDGKYNDYCVAPEDSDPVAGICHARGCNADQPPGWMIYITVANLDKSLEKVKKRGGEVLQEPRGAGGGRMCVIKDPAGATCALFEPAE